MSLKILKDPKEVVKILAEHLEANKKAKIVFGLCGGRSIVGILNALKEQQQLISPTTWRKLQFFMVDERRVKITDDDSNYRGVYELFLKDAVATGLIKKKQLHPFETDANDYQRALGKFGGKFDVVILGVGEDGHVAGLFPGHWAFESDYEGFISFDDSPKLPPFRITATKNLLKKSTFGIGLFIGESKKEAFLSFQNDNISLEQCPAKLLYELENALVVSDI